jgi:hypothetical protein
MRSLQVDLIVGALHPADLARASNVVTSDADGWLWLAFFGRRRA